MGNSANHAENPKKYSSYDEEDKDDEEDGDSEKSSSSGGGGGAGDSFSPSLNLEPSELKELAAKENTRAKHDRGSRTDFVEEIKALNAVRARFSEIPLKDQIVHIDKLMVKLDIRVQHLERLKERSSLSSALKRAMSKLLEMSAVTILQRQENRVVVKLSEGEKQAKFERQQKRYGRTYRAGLHAQIKEMKQNLAILKTKQVEYTRYKSFVEKIEKQLDKQPSKVFEISKTRPVKKRITNQESSLRLALKANIAREQISIEYRVKAGDKLTSLEVKPNKAHTDIRNDQSKLIKDTHSIETKTSIENNKLQSFNKKNSIIKLGVSVKVDSEKLRAVFNVKAEFDPQIKNNPHPSYKQKIKNFDPIKTHQVQKETQSTSPTKNERSSWFTPASEKTKLMMKEIAKKIAQQRKAQPQVKAEKQHNINTKKGQFNVHASEKFTTNEAHRAKTRVEAETRRSHMLFKYRAKPYSLESNKEPKNKPQEQSFKNKVQSI